MMHEINPHVYNPEYMGFAGITASQIWRFYDGRKYCGRCGEKTILSSRERVVIC